MQRVLLKEYYTIPKRKRLGIFVYNTDTDRAFMTCGEVSAYDIMFIEKGGMTNEEGNRCIDLAG